MDKAEFRRQVMMLHPDHGGSHDEFLEFIKQAKGDHQPDNAKQISVSELLAFLQSTSTSPRRWQIGSGPEQQN